MVNVTIEVEGVTEDGQQLSTAILDWATRHPGHEQLVVQIQQTMNGGVFRPAPTMWPTGVAATIESFEKLGSVVGEHALAYDIQYRPLRPDQMGFGVGHGHVSPVEPFAHITGLGFDDRPKPGMFTREGLREFFLGHRLSLVDVLVILSLGTFAQRVWSAIS